MPTVRTDSFAHNSLKLLTIAGLAAIPLIVMTGVHDYFRVIKEIGFRAQAILMLFALVTLLLYGGSARLREQLRQRAVVLIIAAAVLWSIITTAASTNRLLSAESLVTAICGAALFVAVWYVSRSVPVTALLILVPVAVVNSVLLTLQEYEIWNPFHFTVVVGRHFTATALIGNPNDVGAYLGLVAIILFALALQLRGWRRWTAAAGFAAAVSGLLVSQTRTAIIALGAALLVYAARRSWKYAIAFSGLFAALLFLAILVPIPGLKRLTEIPRMVSEGRLDSMLSYRLSPFLGAVEMFKERPLLGRGPGVYAFDEMPYRMRAKRKYGGRAIRTVGLNFSETHNDHLQLLAETGVPGYALFLAALMVVAWQSRRTASAHDERTAAAVAIGLPLAAMVFVLCLASFPLQLAVTRHLLLTAAALIIGWKEP